MYFVDYLEDCESGMCSYAVRHCRHHTILGTEFTFPMQ